MESDKWLELVHSHSVPQRMYVCEFPKDIVMVVVVMRLVITQ